MSEKNFKENIPAGIENRRVDLTARFDAVDNRVRDVCPPMVVVHDTKTQPPEAPAKKSSVVKDSFSMPPEDYAIIENVRLHAAKNGRIYTKSEVIRASLRHFRCAGQDVQFDALKEFERLGPGRKK